MKTSIKDIVIGAFAVIGFYVVVTGFNSPVEQQAVMTATPESHAWELGGFGNDFFMWNKKTGEVRKLNGNSYDAGGDEMNKYLVMEESSK